MSADIFGNSNDIASKGVEAHRHNRQKKNESNFVFLLPALFLNMNNTL